MKKSINFIPSPAKAKGYRYKDKDPILYLVLHLMDESGMSDNQISERSGVTQAPCTVGGTKTCASRSSQPFGPCSRPSGLTLQASPPRESSSASKMYSAQRSKPTRFGLPTRPKKKKGKGR